MTQRPEPDLYFEDFTPGRTFELGTVTPTAEEIVVFARAFDPQPFHVDEDAARRGPFGGLTASGWHAGALFMRLLVDGLLIRAAGLGAAGINQLRWLKPVRPGMALTGRMTVLAARPSRSQPDRGIVTSRNELVDVAGEPVVQMEALSFFRRRPGPSAWRSPS